jgi:alcohol dehydrogenase class IV
LLHSSSTAPIAPTAPVAPIAPSSTLATRLDALAVAGHLPTTLRQAGVSADDLAALAEEAAEQWTGRFNPRPFDAKGALEIYRCAL